MSIANLTELTAQVRNVIIPRREGIPGKSVENQNITPKCLKIGKNSRSNLKISKIIKKLTILNCKSGFSKIELIILPTDRYHFLNYQ
ncbi:MAG: hypothetical protein Q8P35_01900 [Candidatus Yanofskybacteria bacterium]|nr:hypothetical protein [Candidatus Yanofskybacteria bacterium]